MLHTRISITPRARYRRNDQAHQETNLNENHLTSVSRFRTQGRLLVTSRFCLALVITSALLLSQVVLFHYYFGINSSQLAKLYNSGSSETTVWNCIYPELDGIYDLAQKFGVDLVVIDPDLIKNFETEQNDKFDENNEVKVPVFSEPFKRNQESGHKSIVHLAAVNETSGGQPNLKLFYNALKSNNYILLKYDDASQLMQPEVYRQAPHLFDEMPLDGLRNVHQQSHDSNLSHDSFLDSIVTEEEQVKVSKIYTEFMSHIFILNTTKAFGARRSCDSYFTSYRFTVIHIIVLYNYEYNPSNQWIQSALQMDEIDKHKLLSYNVHSVDFKVPIGQYYLHPKKDIVSVSRVGSRIKRSLSKPIRMFAEDRLLTYANNTYIHCSASPFNIEGLRGRKTSKYLRDLDSSKPFEDHEVRSHINQQLVTAFQFMDTFSKAYDNFSYWVTGSTLLAYHKHCELAVKLDFESTEPSASSGLPIEQGHKDELDSIVVNLELGIFSSEVNDSALRDLADAHTIGVVMLSDWRKSVDLVIFQLRDCPYLIFNLYIYELRRDFDQHYFITRNTMTMSHKFSKKSRSTKSMLNNPSIGHHVFSTLNLDLCWTRTNDLNPFRVPCNVYDHLRRIYVI